jgi:glycerol uptake facilitator-like aquaporin
MTEANSRQLAAEALGTALLIATVVGSGIMAAKLSGGNIGLALLANALATGAMLVVLITVLGPISGAHFNPVVSLVMVLRGELAGPQLLPFTLAQIAGGCCGTLLAHAMFDLPLVQVSTGAQRAIKYGATVGLPAVFVLLGLARFWAMRRRKQG